MGYVTRIAMLIHIEDENNSDFHDLLRKEVPSTCLDEWAEFVTNTLKAIIELHTTCLVRIFSSLRVTVTSVEWLIDKLSIIKSPLSMVFLPL